MCGRYVVIARFDEFEARYYFKTKEVTEVYFHNYNIGPGTKAPVITDDKPDELQYFIFGMTPSWAKKKMYFFNARAEGDSNKENDPNYTGGKDIITKPSFRKPIRSQRCLIPCSGFIEGPEKEKLDKPYFVFLPEEKMFSLAGIWDKWVDETTGEVVYSFAIITTVANKLLQKIGHHRSPVIIPREKERDWINKELPLSKVTAMLEPYPAEKMNAYPIDKRIKNPRVNDVDLLRPMGELVYPISGYEARYYLELKGMKE